MPERAIELEEFGIRNNPDEWRLYYNAGFIRYMELKDYAGAAEAFARGARVPNAHPFLAVLAGRMAEHAGDRQMARMMWSTSYTRPRKIRTCGPMPRPTCGPCRSMKMSPIWKL